MGEVREDRSRSVGVKVIVNGLVAAIHHFILAYQLEVRCSRKDALEAAISILDGLKDLVNNELREESNGSKEDSAVPEEDIAGESNPISPPVDTSGRPDQNSDTGSIPS